MSIRWDARNKRWRWEFDRYVEGHRHRLSRLLPRGWSQAKADAYDRTESARVYAVATGVQQRDPLISEAVALYLHDKTALKSYRAAAEHLAAIAWAYIDKPMSELAAVAEDVVRRSEVAPATVRNRLALLKAACRWAWKRHGLVEADPAARMRMPTVRNERHLYITRREMLTICRACCNWQAQVAIRVSFYSGLRLGELLRATSDGEALWLEDSKNGLRRVVPAHPRVRHLLRMLPLPGPRISIQAAFRRAARSVDLGQFHFHDLRHSAASEMINAGIDLYTVGRVLGHKDQRSTARYAHLTHGTLAEAVSRIGRRA